MKLARPRENQAMNIESENNPELAVIRPYFMIVLTGFIQEAHARATYSKCLAFSLDRKCCSTRLR